MRNNHYSEKIAISKADKIILDTEILKDFKKENPDESEFVPYWKLVRFIMRKAFGIEYREKIKTLESKIENDRHNNNK